MDNQAKEFMVHALRKEFIAFMQAMAKIPGSHVQKQQAFLRFDEGHMWMQNAVLSYVAPQHEAETAPKADETGNLSPAEIQELTPKAIEVEEGSVMTREGAPIVSPAE